MIALPPIRWNADGLAPVVIADAATGAVLTLAYVNREALERTIETRSTWLWSRSRGRAVEQRRDLGQHAARGRHLGRLRR